MLVNFLFLGLLLTLFKLVEVWTKWRTLVQTHTQLTQEHTTLQEKHSSLQHDYAMCTVEMEQQKKWYLEKEKLLQQHYLDHFEKRSREVLNANQTTLQQTHKQHTEHYLERAQSLLKPLEKTISQLQEQTRQSEQRWSSLLGGLRQAVTSQTTAAVELQQQAAALTNALKSPTARGRWGEIQLKRIAEMAGMQNYCDFEEQVTLDEGTKRPDMVVRLPGKKVIIVDAKVPLDAYLLAHNEPHVHDSPHLAAHAQALQRHIQQLAAKRYWEENNSPNFVVLFLPGEGLLSAALHVMPHLLEEAANKRVMLATPSTLITMLRTVALSWQEVQATQKADEIIALGKTLYERLHHLWDHFGSVRKNLDRTCGAFNKLIGALETRTLPAARRLAEYHPSTEPLPAIETTQDRLKT